MVYVILLIGVGLYAIFFVVKTLSSGGADVKGTPVLGETFPDIDYVNPENSTNPLVNVADGYKSLRHEPKQNFAVPVAEKRVGIPVETKREERRFSLKSKSDARRAFVEAEIFNRKY